jgi:hypothetical protein
MSDALELAGRRPLITAGIKRSAKECIWCGTRELSHRPATACDGRR